MTTQRNLEAIAARSRCARCGEQPQVAWLPTGGTGLDGLQVYAFRLRCRCHPQAPTLEKRPRSELSKALADPNYATDAVTRMSATRILEKRRRPVV